MIQTILATIRRIILSGGVPLDGVGTHIGGGITDTIRTISSRTIILANITATTMPGTITMHM
ncbi:MAG: hypothetical protein ACLQPD_20920 [Desulfomonilaceae bacterium]